MKALAVQFVLLAERDAFRDMGAGFREKKQHFSGGDLLLYLGLVIALFAVIGAVAWVVNRQDRHQLFNSPRALFRSLCRAHKLDASQRRLLQNIAKAQELDPPARLFVEPSALATARQQPEFKSSQTAIGELASILYAAPEMAG